MCGDNLGTLWAGQFLATPIPGVWQLKMLFRLFQSEGGRIWTLIINLVMCVAGLGTLWAGQVRATPTTGGVAAEKRCLGYFRVKEA